MFSVSTYIRTARRLEKQGEFEKAFAELNRASSRLRSSSVTGKTLQAQRLVLHKEMGRLAAAEYKRKYQPNPSRRKSRRRNPEGRSRPVLRDYGGKKYMEYFYVMRSSRGEPSKILSLGKDEVIQPRFLNAWAKAGYTSMLGPYSAYKTAKARAGL